MLNAFDLPQYLGFFSLGIHIPQTVLTVGVLTVLLLEGPMAPLTKRRRCQGADFLVLYNTNSKSPRKNFFILLEMNEDVGVLVGIYCNNCFRDLSGLLGPGEPTAAKASEAVAKRPPLISEASQVPPARFQVQNHDKKLAESMLMLTVFRVRLHRKSCARGVLVRTPRFVNFL